jgi:hypothetical protein
VRAHANAQAKAAMAAKPRIEVEIVRVGLLVKVATIT